jgi:hypothetical protein
MIQVKLQVCILQFILKKDTLVELCVSNYVTFYGLVNPIDGILKTSTTYCENNHYMIQKKHYRLKIGMLILIYNILGVCPSGPPPWVVCWGGGFIRYVSVPSSIHPSSSSRKKKMMEEEEEDEWWQQQFIIVK